MALPQPPSWIQGVLLLRKEKKEKKKEKKKMGKIEGKKGKVGNGEARGIFRPLLAEA